MNKEHGYLALFLVSLAFTVGCGGKQGLKSAVPAHQVALKPFYLDQQEVTVEEYRRCVDQAACRPVDNKASQCTFNKPGDLKDHPVNCVTWKQASEYCKWAGKRLPTEAEWEYAARSAGKQIPYPWGKEPPSEERVARSLGNGPAATSPVCNKIFGNTTQGICDMAGNLAEWTMDVYHDSYKGAPADGSAWVSPIGSSRAVRGGNFMSADQDSYRTEYREGQKDTAASLTLGFRCSLSVPERTQSKKGAWFGVEVRSASMSLRKKNDIEQRVAAEIIEVHPGSPAEAKGLEVGDLIVQIKGEEIHYTAELAYVLSQHKPGDLLAIQIIKQGKPKIIDVELAKIPKSK